MLATDEKPNAPLPLSIRKQERKARDAIAAVFVTIAVSVVFFVEVPFYADGRRDLNCVVVIGFCEDEFLFERTEFVSW